MSRRPLRVLGVMTGTSCDGLDASCVSFRPGSGKGFDWDTDWTASLPYPAGIRRRVLALQLPGRKVAVRELLELDRDLGDWYGRSCRALASRAPRGSRPDVVACHGQTVAHHPGRGGSGVTLQLGEPARIARLTGLTTAARFRDGDLSAGGQGAPLLPLFHRALAESRARAQLRRGVAIHNLGGISNLTYLSPSGETLAFDTGPANAWIDEAASRATNGRARFDRDGRMAARGRVDARGLARLLRHPFLRLPPPKSTGRDDFPFELLLKATRSRGEDLVALATAFTIESIARAYERSGLGTRRRPLRVTYLCGGGARNSTLAHGLAERLGTRGIDVARIDALAGFDPQAIESQGFAYFGLLALLGRPIGGAWTGARGFAPPACVVPGENWARVAAWVAGASAAR